MTPAGYVQGAVCQQRAPKECCAASQLAVWILDTRRSWVWVLLCVCLWLLGGLLNYQEIIHASLQGPFLSVDHRLRIPLLTPRPKELRLLSKTCLALGFCQGSLHLQFCKAFLLRKRRLTRLRWSPFQYYAQRPI